MNKVHTKNSSLNDEGLLFISIEILVKDRQQQYSNSSHIQTKIKKLELQYLVSQV